MAFLEISGRDRLDLTMLHAAMSDLNQATIWAEHIMKKKWYRRPWSRGATYSHQSAYVTAIVMAYGRVFSKGRNGRRFPEKLIDYDADDRALHERLLDMRNAVYAHSALDQWTVKPWKVDRFETTVIGQPVNVIEEADLQRLIAMAARLRTAASKRYAAIVAPYKAAATASGEGKPAIDLAMHAIGQLEVGQVLAIPIAEDPA